MPAAKERVPIIHKPQTWPRPVRTTLDWIVAQLHFALGGLALVLGDGHEFQVVRHLGLAQNLAELGQPLVLLEVES